MYVADAAVRAIVGSRFKDREGFFPADGGGARALLTAELAGPVPVVAGGDGRQQSAEQDEAYPHGDYGVLGWDNRGA